MRKTALTHRQLMSVEKPARYIGNERNSVIKDPDKMKTRFVMCFPDVYEIGMSYLGIQIIYDLLNQRESTYCERVYSPWLDLDALMRKEQIPLFSLETQTPVRQFDFLGITLQYEMCYTNILQVLDLSGIPLYAKDRTEEDPLVIGGGPCAYNPEPIADFFDLFNFGEAESTMDAIMDCYEACKDKGLGRMETLKALAQVPGVYVPAFYDVTYNSDGTISAFTPNCSEAPAVVKRQLPADLKGSVYPVKPVVPFIQVTQDRMVLEIQRGCIRGCRFCQAGMVYRPLRERSLEELKAYALELFANTGYDEITLSSLSSSDYRYLPELIDFLIEQLGSRYVNISLPSLRIDAFSLDVMHRVQDVKKSSLTFAPEAGSQRMRDVINKGLDEETILEGAKNAFAGGWNKVKLYFMLGLPTETEEDIKGIAYLSEKIAECYYDLPKEQRSGRCQVTASSSFFVPKPFTPFQWAKMDRKESFLEKAAIVHQTFLEQKNRKSLKYNWHEADLSVLEGIFARGDRRLSAVIERAYRKGAKFDAWSEYFIPEYWEQAFAECSVDPDYYVHRERSYEEILPWDFIDIGVSKAFLIRENEKAKQGKVTAHCRKVCAGCGAVSFKGGVCVETAD